MINVIPIQLAVEDSLSEVVLRVILQQSNRPYAVGTCYRRHGFGYLKKRIQGFNNAAKGTPFLVLTDLDKDKAECPPLLIQQWLSVPKHNNLVFRVAVRAVEAWLLAHRSTFAEFLGIRENLVPENPDKLDDPKSTLINLTSKSRRRELREAIIPTAGSKVKIGPDYNGKLADFVQSDWDVKEAIKHSPSLKKAVNAIKVFRPTFEKHRDV